MKITIRAPRKSSFFSETKAIGLALAVKNQELLKKLYLYIQNKGGSLSNEREFMIAILFDQRNEITRLLKENPTLTSSTDSEGANCVLWATSLYNKELLQFLIELTQSMDILLNVDAFTEEGNNSITPLIIAASTRDASMVKLLLDAGADVNKSDGSTLTPLFAAGVLCPNSEVVKLLLDAGADINKPDKYGYTPLSRLTSPVLYVCDDPSSADREHLKVVALLENACKASDKNANKANYASKTDFGLYLQETGMIQGWSIINKHRNSP